MGVFPSISIQTMKPRSFTSSTTMNEQENYGKKSSISCEGGKTDELAREDEKKQRKSFDLEVLESNENKIIKRTENIFDISILDRSNEFAELQKENAALKNELHSIEQLFAASA